MEKKTLPFNGTKEQEQQLRDVLADDQYKVMNKPEIRVIYYLGMFTGQRLKDCVLLQWQNIDLHHKRIYVKQLKTGKEVSIPIAEELYRVLKEAEAWKAANEAILAETVDTVAVDDEAAVDAALEAYEALSDGD